MALILSSQVKMKGQLTIQNYKSYTKDDQKTWSTLFERQVENLKQNNKVVEEFWEGLTKLKIKKGEIPNFENINKFLKPITGFEIVAVTGLLDDNIFFQLIKNKKFPVTTWIRKSEQIDYIEEPDMFHDLFGHVPFLVNKSYTTLLIELAEYALPAFQRNDKLFKDVFIRIYWYSIEFGILLNKENQYQIYGAGILSSFSETNKVFDTNTPKRQFLPDLLKEEIDKEHLQNFYAAISNQLEGISFSGAIEKLKELIQYENDQQYGRHNP